MCIFQFIFNIISDSLVSYCMWLRRLNSTNFAIALKYFNKITIQLNWLYKMSTI